MGGSKKVVSSTFEKTTDVLQFFISHFTWAKKVKSGVFELGSRPYTGSRCIYKLTYKEGFEKGCMVSEASVGPLLLHNLILPPMFSMFYQMYRTCVWFGTSGLICPCKVVNDTHVLYKDQSKSRNKCVLNLDNANLKLQICCVLCLL